MPQKKSSKKKYESGGFNLGEFFFPAYQKTEQSKRAKAAIAKRKAKAKAKKMVHKPMLEILQLLLVLVRLKQQKKVFWKGLQRLRNL
jgi:hypothetical protein